MEQPIRFPRLSSSPSSQSPRPGLAELRHLLAERFTLNSRPPERLLPTGLPAIDTVMGGLPLGALTEVCCTAPSCGSHLLFGRLLEITRRAQRRVALVDSDDSFDPASYPSSDLEHLVWVRCHGAATALALTDILVRDANLGLVVLDLRQTATAELRRVPATHWYRLQRAVEATDLALVVETPHACIASAHVRLSLHQPQPPESWQQPRAALADTLDPVIERQRSVRAFGL
jgi:hypothetical protein